MVLVSVSVPLPMLPMPPPPHARAIAGEGAVGDRQRAGVFRMPPPSSAAEFPESVLFLTVNVPAL